ncbi:SDR family NAD(P)-dependent oxidoreductase [Leuconostoc gelidum]|uniref:SDR family NAD(P)-dependent oxidoreductase n=1 Tax=Leuconostoc gelidum TaxID=1244 RepID=UPI001CC3A5A2|nr:SDR family NAD(P)-dependent oxidoreductase [Leuconostoc gelidum]
MINVGKEGAFVIVDYLTNYKKAETVVKDIVSQGRQAVSKQCDMRNSQQVSDMVHEICDNFGAIRIVINVALSQYRLILKAEQC